MNSPIIDPARHVEYLDKVNRRRSETLVDAEEVFSSGDMVTKGDYYERPVEDSVGTSEAIDFYGGIPITYKTSETRIVQKTLYAKNIQIDGQLVEARGDDSAAQEIGRRIDDVTFAHNRTKTLRYFLAAEADININNGSGEAYTVRTAEDDGVETLIATGDADYPVVRGEAEAAAEALSTKSHSYGAGIKTPRACCNAKDFWDITRGLPNDYNSPVSLTNTMWNKAPDMDYLTLERLGIAGAMYYHGFLLLGYKNFGGGQPLAATDVDAQIFVDQGTTYLRTTAKFLTSDAIVRAFSPALTGVKTPDDRVSKYNVMLEQRFGAIRTEGVKVVLLQTTRAIPAAFVELGKRYPLTRRGNVALPNSAQSPTPEGGASNFLFTKPVITAVAEAKIQLAKLKNGSARFAINNENANKRYQYLLDKASWPDDSNSRFVNTDHKAKDAVEFIKDEIDSKKNLDVKNDVRGKK